MQPNLSVNIMDSMIPTNIITTNMGVVSNQLLYAVVAAEGCEYNCFSLSNGNV